ncbi:transposase [Pedobacter sp. Leaf176]|uniref:REP-associated tyrosine transposase n=1 Tax=Pedobacter sp. Leaf176 TaxID=1736286 RepID=UPI0006F3C2A5|nr:transposase [Pedobacter sp. Leaf176]KQR67480.1 transposase [Pedobacter sp. Leaf176]
MSSKYKIRDQTKLYFISFSVVHWLDVFIRNEYKDILVDNLKYCQRQKGLEIYAWCIMTSHVHLIIGSNGEKMEDIIRDFKSFTSKCLRKSIAENPVESRKEWLLWMMKRAGSKNSNNENFQFWQQNNHPIELWDNYMIEQKLDYLHNNPVVSGIVDEPMHYLYSSARDYSGFKGLIDIKLIT